MILCYGTYNCGKSSDLIKIYHNYTKKGMYPLSFNVCTSIVNKRNMIMNDMGLNCPAEPVLFDFDFYKYTLYRYAIKKVDIVLVDNGQHLDLGSVNSLRKLANSGIPVVVFALRSDYKGIVYKGTSDLMGISDRIEEIKGMCWCNSRATMNACVDSDFNIIVRNITNDNDNYHFTGVCAKHWDEGKVTKGVLGNKVYNFEYIRAYFSSLKNLYKDKIPISIVIMEFGDKRLKHYVDVKFLTVDDCGFVKINEHVNLEQVFFSDPSILLTSINSQDTYTLEADIMKKLKEMV